MREWIPSLAIARPITVMMTFLGLLVLGGISWSRIPLEMLPSSFELPMMWIWTPYADSSPRETEQQVLLPIEEHLSTVSGLEYMSSRANSRDAFVTLRFYRSGDIDAQYNEVVDRMERAMADLPEEVDRYFVYRWNPSDEPVMWSGISFPEDLENPYWLASQVIEQRLERTPGVGDVEVWGVDPKRVFVDFSLDAMTAHGVDLRDLMQRLGGDNFQLASGRLLEGGMVQYVRSMARYEGLDDLRSVPLTAGYGMIPEGGTVPIGVTLDDVADVSYRLDPTPTIARVDGKSGSAMGIYKVSDANTVETTQNVAKAFRDLEADPRLQGTKFVTFFDQGETIQESINDLLMTALYGGVFAVIVLFAFLREWRMTLLIAACIPFTLLLTVIIMYVMGRSLNLLSMMGLMLAVGMVVDNAIVVVESIYARRQDGEPSKSAAVKGTSEVGLAIMLSTLTTIVVFLPVILMSDSADFSFFMGELGMPVVWALMASLLVAIVFVPLSTLHLGRPVTGNAKNGTAVPTPSRWIGWLISRYSRLLTWVLAHRMDALMGLMAFVILTVVLPMKAVSCEDDSEGNIGEFTIRWAVDADFTYTERLAVVDAVKEMVDENREEWGLRTTRTYMVGSSRHGRTNVYIESNRTKEMMSREEVVEAAKEALPDIPGVEMRVGWGGSRGGEAPQLQLTLRGEETATLENVALEVRRVLSAVPGVIGVSADEEEEGDEEIRLVIDRKETARYGLSADRIGRLVSFALRRNSLSPMRQGVADEHGSGGGGASREVEVVARYRYEDREDLDRLLDFPMWSPTKQAVVPLRAVVKPEVAPALNSIHRRDRQTVFPLTIDIENDAQESVVWADISAALSNIAFPRGYDWDERSRYEKQQQEDDARNMALLLSVVFVFLIMGVLFESLLLPVSIICTIPLALLGVYWVLFFTGTPLDAMGGVGLVVLVGVVVNNGIVLIDLVTQLRAEGVDRATALVQAGERRLRPILMTALTTVFGLLPMAVGSSAFIGMPYAPLGRVVAGGLVAGTLLTLFFVPFMYSVLDDMRMSGSRWRAWITRQPVGSK